MSYTSDTLQCILNIKQTQINVLVIQCQTHLGKIFKCTIFVGYGGVINFERCRTVREILLFIFFFFLIFFFFFFFFFFDSVLRPFQDYFRSYETR